MKPPTPPEAAFSRLVGDKARRKRRAAPDDSPVIWQGLSLFGTVGWTVVVPTLAGAALGVWLDKHAPAPAPLSWTLTLLLAGLVLGCGMAWFWVKQEDKETPPSKSTPKTDD
ncbi:AtpZ/AtpI family protein [Hymenobacter psoromatis]|uniref:AtpZ/AtpI family protein n=1 Tax=Hymenobacter psoromatis TaxID=1484116 RepID=UPI001CBC6F38|nr:AtpZ/AtpI family protein [Hymenobacter psoromatis]